MKLQSLLLVCGLVLVCPGTMRSVSSQSLLDQVPMILNQMNSTQKIALMAEVLMKNPVLYDKLEHILVGALPLISTFSIKPELNKFMLPWVLDTIPKVLQNPLLLNIASGMVSDINEVNITGLNVSGIDPFMHGFMQRFSFVHSGLRAAVESFLISRGLNQQYARTIATKSTVILENCGLKVLDAVIETVNAVDMSGVSTNDSRVIEAEFWKRFSLLSAAGKAVQVLTPVEQFLPKLDNALLSDECYNDTMIYLNSMLQGKKWAVKNTSSSSNPARSTPTTTTATTTTNTTTTTTGNGLLTRDIVSNKYHSTKDGGQVTSDLFKTSNARTILQSTHQIPGKGNSTSQSSQLSADKNKDGSAAGGGVIAGAVVGVLAVAGLSGLLAFFLYRRWKKRKDDMKVEPEEGREKPDSTNQKPPASTRLN
uniref:Uncharacterized protein LOC111137532 n=1 Tax=Crassostrea virginica TaxID=6565 RepID=A0A8B8EYU2_CRAVI|nr:uncharacterized protein LOC111137532 [Crassostrea virginica]